MFFLNGQMVPVGTGDNSPSPVCCSWRHRAGRDTGHASRTGCRGETGACRNTPRPNRGRDPGSPTDGGARIRSPFLRYAPPMIGIWRILPI